MDLASLCPLPVGLVPWASPQPMCSVVIKATFTLDQDGDARLAEVQEPLSLDCASTIDSDELASASDFAPFKAHADILLVGHAKTEEPATAIAGLLRVDGLTRRFYALAGAPSSMIPLSAPYLRAASGETEAMLRVGPEAPWSPARRARLGARTLGENGLPVGPLGQGFDFAFFNVAPPEQQVALLRPSATLLLRGLLADAERREVRLPGLRPVVFLTRRSLSGRGSAMEIALRCDTLVIDADRALCTLTWRGAFEPAEGDESACLLVDVGLPGDKPSFHDVLRKLSQTAAAAADPAPEAGLASAPTPVQGWANDPHGNDRHEEEEEPTGRHFAAPDPEAIRAAGFRLGFPLGAAPIRASQVDSFELKRDRDLPDPPTAHVIAETIRLRDPDLDAAFALAPATPPTAAPRPRTPTLDAVYATDRPLEDGLPFMPAEMEHATISASPSAPTGLEWYAQIKAALWEGTRSRAEVLAAHSLDEVAWSLEEQQQRTALAADARAGQDARVLAVHAALHRAGEGLAGTSDELTTAQYVALRVTVESSPDASAAFRASGLSAAAYRRLHFATMRRAVADPAFGEQLRRALIEARRNR